MRGRNETSYDSQTSRDCRVSQRDKLPPEGLIPGASQISCSSCSLISPNTTLATLKCWPSKILGISCRPSPKYVYGETFQLHDMKRIFNGLASQTATSSGSSG